MGELMDITITLKNKSSFTINGVTRLIYDKGNLLQVYTDGTLPYWNDDFQSFELNAPPMEPKPAGRSKLEDLPTRKKWNE